MNPLTVTIQRAGDGARPMWSGYGARVALAALAVVGLMAQQGRVARAGRVGYLYVGDVSQHDVMRFDDTTGAPVPPNPYIASGGGEGMGGTNTYLAVAGGSAVISIYDVATNPNSPTFVRTIATPGLNALRIAFSADGSKLYAGNIIEGSYPAPGSVTEYDFNTGALLNSITTPNGSWGVAINPLNGKVYYTTGWANGRGAGVFSANPDLSGVTTVVPVGDHGITALVGLAFTKSGDFYVVNGGNGDPNNGFINHYAANGAFLDRLSTAGMPTGALNNAFDAEIGPDNNLYVSSQNGACVLKFDTLADRYDSVFIPANSNGLATAKTIHFTVNNVAVPEPSSLVLIGTGCAAACVYGFRVRRAGSLEDRGLEDEARSHSTAE